MYSIEKEIKNVFFNNPDILERVVKKIIDDKMIDLTRRLTSKEAAKFLNISVKTLDNLCWERKIPFYKLGKSREFLLKDLKQYRLNKEKYIPSLY